MIDTAPWETALREKSARDAERTERRLDRKVLAEAERLRAIPDRYPADVLWHLRSRAERPADLARIERLIADGRLTA